MLSKLPWRKSAPYRVGLGFKSNALSLCVLSDDGTQLVTLDQVSEFNGDLPAVLARWVDEYGLKRAPATVTLGQGWYEYLQSDRPNVPEEELNQALLWSVRELVQIPQDKLLVDYFDPPAQPMGVNKVNVICADRTRLQPLVDAILASGLELQCISVEEVTLPGLLAAEEDAQLVLYQERGDELSLSIVKQGRLHFMRRLRGYATLPDLTQEELQSGVLDNLSLELQRSMDMYESQLRQAPVRGIKLAIESPLQSQMAELISANFFQSVNVLTSPLLLPEQHTIAAFPALAAALHLGLGEVA